MYMRACKCTGNDERKRENRETERKKLFKAIFLSFSSFIPFLLIFPTNSLFAFSNVIFSLLFSLSLSYFFISLSLSLFLRNTIDWSNATCKSDLALASCVLDKRHKLMSLSLSLFSLFSSLFSLPSPVRTYVLLVYYPFFFSINFKRRLLYLSNQ